MLGYNSLSLNDKNNLSISGCDCTELVKKYGTPLYVMDEVEIRRRCREIKINHMDKYKGFAVYASKAFLNKEMCRIIMSEGLGLDVVSGGELYTANSVGFPMDKIIFHGNNKAPHELEMAVSLNVGRIVVDNFYEMDNLNRICKNENRIAKVMLRISPGIDGHTHEYIQTGNLDSKFGFSLNDGAALEAVKRVLSMENLNLVGLHAHLGSQLNDNKIYDVEVKVLAQFAKNLHGQFGYILEELNVGGGFGIYYSDEDLRREIGFFTEVINNSVKSEFKRHGLKHPMIIIEPGRWLVGEAGITLYTLGAIKNIKGIRKYISVDGGMTDNIRTPLYDAVYSALIANDKEDYENEVVTIAGRCCESGDILIRDINLPKIESGDILAVLSTGAYNYSMASNYNRLRKPPVVMVNQGSDRIIVKGETYEDIIRNDI
jgi:diaminopimelate decarboxylase